MRFSGMLWPRPILWSCGCHTFDREVEPGRRRNHYRVGHLLWDLMNDKIKASTPQYRVILMASRDASTQDVLHTCPGVGDMVQRRQAAIDSGLIVWRNKAPGVDDRAVSLRM
jgi:hypothetical protein